MRLYRIVLYVKRITREVYIRRRALCRSGARRRIRQRVAPQCAAGGGEHHVEAGPGRFILGQRHDTGEALRDGRRLEPLHALPIIWYTHETSDGPAAAQNAPCFLSTGESDRRCTRLASRPEQADRDIGQDLMRQFGWPVGMPLCRAMGDGLVGGAEHSDRKPDCAGLVLLHRRPVAGVRTASSRRPRRHPMPTSSLHAGGCANSANRRSHDQRNRAAQRVLPRLTIFSTARAPATSFRPSRSRRCWPGRSPRP